MPKKALIFGVTGQDGSYLAEFLLGKGYSVVGVARDTKSPRNIGGIRDRIILEPFEADSRSFVESMLERHSPDEVYNLAAQSHVGESWERLSETVEACAVLPARIIESIHRLGGGIKFFQASSGALFGGGMRTAQNETAPANPGDPYSLAKYLPHRLVKMFRVRYGYFFCSGILYNHESPRRPESFVSRKITKAAARIKLGKQSELRMGNLNSVRDWGYAPDYVKGMWMMMQSEAPDDYILSTGKGHTVLEFAQAAFHLAGLELEDHLVVDEKLVRPNDGIMVGDPTKIEKALGWKAETPFEEMIKKMVDADIELELRNQDGED